MTIIALTLVILGCAFGVHVIMWRIRVPQKQINMLLYMFMFALVIGLALHFRFEHSLAKRQLPHLSGLFEYALVVVLYVPAALSYIIVYTTLQVDSPTLSLIWHMHSSGKAGLSDDAVARFGAERPFARDRLETLVNDGILMRHGDRVTVAPGMLLGIRFILFFRSLYSGRAVG